MREQITIYLSEYVRGLLQSNNISFIKIEQGHRDITIIPIKLDESKYFIEYNSSK